MKGGESALLSGSSNHCSVFLLLPGGALGLGLFILLTGKAPVPLSSVPHLPAPAFLRL